MSFLQNIFRPIANLGQFWQQSFNGKFFRWNLFFISIQLVLLIWQFVNLPLQVPLYYSLPWGEDQLTSATSLFLLPTFSIIILLLNNLIATFFLKTIPLFSRLLTVFSLIFSFLSAISLTRIITLIS